MPVHSNSAHYVSLSFIRGSIYYNATTDRLSKVEYLFIAISEIFLRPQYMELFLFCFIILPILIQFHCS